MLALRNIAMFFLLKNNTVNNELSQNSDFFMLIVYQLLVGLICLIKNK